MFKKTIFQNTVNKHRTQDTEHRHRTQNTNTANFRFSSGHFLDEPSINGLHTSLEIGLFELVNI